MWPAIGLFAAFAWLELVYGGRAIPAQLALMVMVYSLITWGGMLFFGRGVWLRRGDLFAAAFGILARFSPTEILVTDPAACRGSGGTANAVAMVADCGECLSARRPDRAWNLRPYGAGSWTPMTYRPPWSCSCCFCSPPWPSTASPRRRPGGRRDRAVLDLGASRRGTLPLSAPPGSRLRRGVRRYLRPLRHRNGPGGKRRAVNRRGRPVFVLSLVPIAIAYHLAHSLHVSADPGQFVIRLASDPFGSG